jgi:hypothetical protein
MTNEEATLAVIDALEALAIPYMVVGSLSSNLYGIPRSTHDADFLLQFDAESPLRRLMDHLGPAFRLDPQMTFETVTLTSRYNLDVIDTPFKIELFRLSDDPHDQERFRRRRRMKTLGRDVSMPTAEDVVITKARWLKATRRFKDREDVRDVIAVQGDNLDWPYIYSWCDRHGTRGLLDEIRRSIPPLDLPGQAEPRASS